MAGANQIGSDVIPSSCCCSTVAIAGESSDQKLAAIMTPPVNPKHISKTFLLLDLKRNTKLAPIAVKIHVNKPPIRACKIGDCLINHLYNSYSSILIYFYKYIF